MTVMQNPKYTGIYVFEGIDNVGKSTIVHALKEKINCETSYECFDIAFPGNEPRTLGSLVYDIHHNQEKYFNERINDASLQLMHVASHIDLIQRRITKLKTQRSIILLDRFWWSTYVYGLANDLEKEIIEKIIAPEIVYWNQMNVKRIFLVERECRERDFSTKIDENIVNNYRKLAENDSKSIILANDGRLNDILDIIYEDIFGE